MSPTVRIVLFFVFLPAALGDVKDPKRVADEDGYFKREHSLVRPYQGRGMEIPFWEFGGATVVTQEYIRLTPDRQSKVGTLWNVLPVRVHNWEMLLHFKVHGSGKNLFGDGFAMWYTKQKNEIGEVFGNRNYFTGLGIFFDTYSNHNGEHAHEHPYISAMINNGTLRYDHDRDGTHSQMAGCHIKFRNSLYDTLVAISYINRQLVVMHNLDESTTWKLCFSVNDVDLPTGYHFGITAATGELADNHDVISVKVYDVDHKVRGGDATADSTATEDWSTVMPHVKNAEPPRAHVSDRVPLMRPFWYRFFSITMMVVLVVGVVAVFMGVAWKRQQERNKKRFF